MKTGIYAKIKRWSAELTDGMLFSGNPEIRQLDLDRDFHEIERLLRHEEWPFTRYDFEVSHRQPKTVALGAWKDNRFAGFFTTHHFGDVGYLDMMIMDPAFRGSSIARPLYFKTMRQLEQAGMKSFVVHTTNDSARIIGLLGFKQTEINFTLLTRNALDHDKPPADSGPIRRLSEADIDSIVELDAAVFGTRRPDWINALIKFGNGMFFGLTEQQNLQAVICLRPRQDNAVCLDICAANDWTHLQQLISHVLEEHSNSKIECFAKTNSELHKFLVHRGFSVPEFFLDIGPLAQWHRGQKHNLGTGSKVQCLMWL
jgi:hypothetical protein